MTWELALIISIAVAAVATAALIIARDVGKDFGKAPPRPRLDPSPAPFVDTPEANAARRVIPGESREQARARLAKYRKLDG